MIDDEESKVTPQEYHEKWGLGGCHRQHLLLDVRPHIQYQICSLPCSKNVPIDKLMKLSSEQLGVLNSNNLPVICVCRRGNDSQTAVQYLKGKLQAKHPVAIRDFVGGLEAWAELVDNKFPKY